MILFNDLSSIIESKYTGIDLSQNILKSNIIVNPRNDSYRNKTLIINYKYDYIDLNKLSKYNHIISRIPLDIDNYEFIPYDLSKPIDYESIDDIEILTPYYFNRTLDSFELKLPNFILSTNTSDNGYNNVAGFIKSKLTNRINTIKEIKQLHDKMKSRISTISLDNSIKIKNFNQYNYLDSPTIDLATNDYCYTGPSVVIRTPNKRMNVKKNYTVNKFKTYRITDSFRSYNIRFNQIDGFYLFEPINRDLNDRCIEQFESNNGLNICIYFLYYFIRKNHFKSIEGDILTEPLGTLADPVKGQVSLRITKYPKENLEYNPEVFSLSLFGMNRTRQKTRDYLTF